MQHSSTGKGVKVAYTFMRSKIRNQNNLVHLNCFHYIVVANAFYRYADIKYLKDNRDNNNFIQTLSIQRRVLINYHTKRLNRSRLNKVRDIINADMAK